MLTSIFYSLKYNARLLVGKNTKIDIDRSGTLRIKDNSHILIGVRGFDSRRPTLLRIQKYGSIIAEDGVSINCGSLVFIYKKAILKVGENTYINSESNIFCNNKIIIGKDCAIGFKVTIWDGNGHQLYIDNVLKPSNGTVQIGNHVWIGANAAILKNVKIGNDSVVAAYSLLKSNVPSESLSVGVANKGIIENVKWEL